VPACCYPTGFNWGISIFPAITHHISMIRCTFSQRHGRAALLVVLPSLELEKLELNIMLPWSLGGRPGLKNGENHVFISVGKKTPIIINN
jgi:hypothetical protein